MSSVGPKGLARMRGPLRSQEERERCYVVVKAGGVAGDVATFVNQHSGRHSKIDRPPESPLQDILAISVVAALVLVFFWKFVLLGQIPTNADWLPHYSPWKSGEHAAPLPHNPEIGDSIAQLYPFRVYTAESLKNGIIPLWNPYIFAGNLYLANGQSAVFDPFGLVFLLFPGPVAFGVLLMLQLFTAGLLMYLFLKALDIVWPAALLGAIAFTFNGFFMTWLENTVFVASALWTPLIFLLLHRLRQTGRSVYAAWCAFPTAFVFLGGMAQLALYALPAACLYYLAGITIESKGLTEARPRWRALNLLCLACILGICLAAVQLFPMVESLPLIQRQQGAPRYAAVNYLEPRELLNLAFPTFLGHPADYDFLGTDSQRTAYVGVLPLLLAGVAVSVSRAREARFFKWLAGGILGLLLALNVTTLHTLIVRLLPSFDRMDQARMLFLVAFALDALAAYGLDAVLTAREPSALGAAPRRLGLLVVLGLGLLLGVTLLANFARRPLVALAMAYLGARFEEAPAYYRQRLDLLFQLFTPTHLGVLVPLLMAGAGLILVRLFATRRLPRPLFLALLVGGAAAYLLSFGLKYNTFVKPELVYPPTEATTFLQKDPELFRVAPISEEIIHSEYFLYRDPAGQPRFPYRSWGPMPPDTNMPYRLQVPGGYDSIRLASYQAYIQLFQPGPSLNAVILTRYDSALLDLVNVKYILTDQEIQFPKFELVFNRGTKIYRNRAVLPRAFIVPQAEVLAREELVKARLQSPAFDPRKTVLLQEEPAGAPAGGGQGAASVVSYQAEEVVIQASVSSGGGWLVLSDAFYPGWEATVDGKSAKIYRADYAFRAVPLPEGTHLVRFAYHPLSYRLGRSISLATLLLIGVLIGRSAWTRRPRRAEPEGRSA